MFRHKGAGRTYSHNLRLASILSGVAGTVNITGVLSVNTLTTNVTGHFAFFSQELFLQDFTAASVILLYVLSFLFGAFISGILTEVVSRKRSHLSYVIPIAMEIAILLGIAILYTLSHEAIVSYPVALSNALLFSMGLQNALVTRISDSVVRTTHLTGLFTDLGIELSQLFFLKRNNNEKKVRRSIFLKFIIIACFFLGGLCGGLLYMHFNLRSLLLPAGLLLFALWYDRLLFRYYHFKRKIQALRNPEHL